MSKSQSIRAGRAFVELFADDSKLVRGLKRAAAMLRAFGASIRNMGLKLAGLGAAVATPLLASTKVLSKLGDLLQTAKERTIGVAGTFNAAALLGLQAGGAEDRIASATERTAKGVEGLRQDVKNNRPAFV